jgi:hypothetical protein
MCKHEYVGIGMSPKSFRCLRCGEVYIPESESHEDYENIRMALDAKRYRYIRENYLWDDGNGEMILCSGLRCPKSPNHADIDKCIDDDIAF